MVRALGIDALIVLGGSLGVKAPEQDKFSAKQALSLALDHVITIQFRSRGNRDFVQ